jgi:hypothetical protein
MWLEWATIKKQNTGKNLKEPLSRPANYRLGGHSGTDYHRKKNMTTLTCPSKDDGLGASAEGAIIEGFSFCFLSVLFGGRGIIVTSYNEIGASTPVDTVLSELTFAFFEGRGSISPSELHKQM